MGRTTFLKIGALVLVITAATGCPGKKKNKGAAAPPKKTSCQELKAAMPADFIQGTVEVPENYDQPAGRKIKVYYYGRLGSGGIPSTVFFNGGPAADSHSSYQSLQQITKATEASYASYPILYIDQRGTGCSDAYPKGDSEEVVERLSHYGSIEIVKDAEVIRKKLIGSTKWRVYGQSHGALIGQRYLVVAPEGIRSLHAHGYAPNDDEIGYLTSRVRSQGKFAAEYFNEYPGDQERYLQIEKLLNDSVCVGPDKCGKRILYSFVDLLGFNNYWSFMHSTLESFLKNGSLDQKALNDYAKIALDGDEEGEDAATVITWVEHGLLGFIPETCQEIFSRLRQEGLKPETWPMHDCRQSEALTAKEKSQIQELPRILAKIPQRRMTPDMLYTAVAHSPGIPVFLYAGVKDTFSPPAAFADIVNLAGSKIHFKTFPETGHEGYSSELEVWTNLANEQ